MDYVNCTGSEYTLWDCPHFTHSYGCSHSDDVGVRCQPGQRVTYIDPVNLYLEHLYINRILIFI